MCQSRPSLAQRGILFLISLILTGCALGSSSSSTPQPVPTVPPTTMVATVMPTPPSSTPIVVTPTVATLPQPGETPIITLVPTEPVVTRVTPITTDQLYTDNRSGPVALMQSLINALNRHEYVRAYSYWEEPETNSHVPPFAEFQQGYANTAAVQLQIGNLSGGVAAGNTYWSVPAILTAQTTQGETQTFVGCYTLHLGSPAAQGVLPFRPLAIQSAVVTQVANNADTQSLLAQACAESGGQPWPAPTSSDPADVSANRYLDDRSNGTQVIRSYINAINLREYVRAYSYWQNPENTPGLPSFTDFVAGYEDTVSVQLYTGAETGDAGAGQWYYQVPVVLVSQAPGGETQTFAGCYILHLSDPAIQGTPPFQPLGIQSANIQPVTNNGNIEQLMPVCQ